jgi:hypothetical protein
MTFLKKAATIAALAGAGVIGTAGMAAAAVDDHWQAMEHNMAGDDGVGQGGLIPVNALHTINVAPNFGCLLDQTMPDLAAQGLGGVVPVGASLNHLLQHANLNLLSNGNSTTENYDNSCTANQGSSQAGNTSRSTTGAGTSASTHSSGENAGSNNPAAATGAGGLMGSTGLLGKGGLGL